MKIAKKTIPYVILTVMAIFVAFPIIWVVISSFKDITEIYAKDMVWLPKEMQWNNYTEVLDKTFLVRSFFNSLKVALPPVIIGVFTSAMAGFAFSKLRFPGKNMLFAAMFSTIAIPGVVTMIPSYILFNEYGWLGTLMPLIIPGMCGSVMTMFFLRQFFSGLPSDMMEAAVIDGMSYGGIFMKIYLPLAKPALITQLLLSFNGAYNDYMGPLLYIDQERHQTIQQVLNSFVQEFAANWEYMLAGSVLALLPTTIIFIVAQKYLVQGIAFTGLKG